MPNFEPKLDTCLIYSVHHHSIAQQILASNEKLILLGAHIGSAIVVQRV